MTGVQESEAQEQVVGQHGAMQASPLHTTPLPLSRVGFLEEGPKVRRDRGWSTKGTRKGPHLRSQPPLPLQQTREREMLPHREGGTLPWLPVRRECVGGGAATAVRAVGGVLMRPAEPM